MSKNYIPEVAKMLGVEIGEEFDVLFENGLDAEYNPYKFTDTEMVDCDGDESSFTMLDLLTGEYTLQKRPWRPKDDNEYWFVELDGDVQYSYFYKDNESDLASLNMGNCFQSKEAAKAAVPEMLAKFEEIKKGVRE